MVQDVIKKIRWLGHDGFRIDSGKVIYFDPYQIKSAVPADIIFISHDHFDHCSEDDIKKIQTKDTVIVTDAVTAKKLKGSIRVVKPGDKLTVENVAIEVVPSYNTNKTFHPKASGMLGFIVTIEGVRIYHAGDTDFIPEMSSIKTDIALLPVSGTYVMTAEEAVQAALAIKPAIAIPMHFNALVGSEKDAALFKEKLAGKIEVVILKQE
ncbi:MAG: MBL fold metallo-hydrolase [Proteobacteria bacterium]|nr:MBL fold metallo-hydrolase [Pseudomonadota bacterium]